MVIEIGAEILSEGALEHGQKLNRSWGHWDKHGKLVSNKGRGMVSFGRLGVRRFLNTYLYVLARRWETVGVHTYYILRKIPHQ